VPIRRCGRFCTGEPDCVRLMKIAPISQEMILNFLGSHVLGLPRSY
jgi:hypothetical protein